MFGNQAILKTNNSKNSEKQSDTKQNLKTRRFRKKKKKLYSKNSNYY